MDRQIGLLRQFYSGLIGMNPDSISLTSWEGALRMRMEDLNIRSPETYWLMIQRSKQEQGEFLEHLVVPETWLFRHKESYAYLKSLVHNEWIKKDRRAEPLRILSIPSSTGEEPYSIAITLLEAGVPPGWFTIEAVDISNKFIKEAATGVIAERSFRGCDDRYKTTYFTSVKGNAYQVQHFVRKQVRFMQGNLVTSNFLIERRPYDIIFCRNLFIYLTPSAQEKARVNLERVLTDQGLLFVSPVESQIIRSWGFVPEGPADACAFLKQPKTAEVVASPVNKNVPQVANLSALLEEVRHHADEGNFESAATLCEKYLQIENTNSEAQFLMGIIEQARGNEYNAEKSFSRAIYLNPKHIEALVCLSLLLEKKGDYKQAELLRERVKREKV